MNVYAFLAFLGGGAALFGAFSALRLFRGARMDGARIQIERAGVVYSKGPSAADAKKIAQSFIRTEAQIGVPPVEPAAPTESSSPKATGAAPPSPTPHKKLEQKRLSAETLQQSLPRAGPKTEGAEEITIPAAREIDLTGGQGQRRRTKNDTDSVLSQTRIEKIRRNVKGPPDRATLMTACGVVVIVFALSVAVLWCLTKIGPIAAQVDLSIKKLGGNLWIAATGLFGCFFAIALLGFGAIYIFSGRR
jgi:hypothetical protein